MERDDTLGRHVPVLARVATDDFARVVSSVGAWYLRLKRTLDVVTAVVLVVVLLPLLSAIVLLVRLTSPGPALFRQRRIGQHGRPFTMYKFRSMSLDADPRIHEQAIDAYVRGHALASGTSSLPFKLSGDRRVTRVGGALRKTSLDELPQLFNVIRGDMSLVGPRPALPYEVARYTARELPRLSVPQGMTGFWQVKGRGRVPYQEALALDIAYVRQRSFALDVKILLLTIPTLLFARGGA